MCPPGVQATENNGGAADRTGTSDSAAGSRDVLGDKVGAARRYVGDDGDMGDAGSRDRDSIGPVGPDDRGCAGCGSDMSKHVASAASLCVLVGFGVKFLRRFANRRGIV